MSSGTLPPKNTSFRWTQSPNPQWKPGDGLGDSETAEAWRKDEEKGWKTVDPAETKPVYLYHLMTSGIVPRPVGFLSSISDTGVLNLAPFSWFQMVTHSPPLILLSISDNGGKNKDSLANIKSTNGFTVSIISEPWVEASNFTSADAPPEVEEWKGAGLHPEPSTHVKAPWVRESAFAMECELYELKEIREPASGKLTVTIVYGLVKLIHVRNAVLTPEGVIDAGLLKPIARLGGAQYATLGEGFSIPRPRWATVKDSVAELERAGK
ncbi:hypothetical protein PLICRDRAFT_115654 [Plicaturopsis crispa FD-325 SS-3]|nr:hypothetical protein PLICRDRAFT_115654 [Plicaturopsis crispa FD-325 SS-3]